MKAHLFFIKLFISFALLIIIPVIIIYSISNREIMINSENAIGKNCVGNLMTADKGIQQLKKSLYKDSLNFSSDYSVINMNSYLSNTDSFSGDEMISMSQILNRLIKMVQANDEYYSIYLYLDNFNYTFTSDKDLVANDKLTDTDWMKYYIGYKNKKIPLSFINTRLLDTSNNTFTNSSAYVTTYIYPLTPYTTSLGGAIVININESTISKMVNNNASSKDGSVLIINSSGEVVSDIDNGMLCKNISKQDYIANILKSKKTSGYFFSKVGSTDSLVSYYKSGFDNWIYIGVAPLNILINSQKAINNNTVIISLIVLILGVLIAFMASKRIYDPVDIMVKTIKSKKLVNLKENEDEMSIIYKALNTISKSSANYHERDKKKLQENCAIKLLSDDPPDNEDKSVLCDVFCYDCFICAVISIDEYSETMENYEEKQWVYIKSLLLELSEEIIGENFKYIGCTVKKGDISIICNVDSSHCDGCQESLQECLIKLQKEVAKILDNTITVGIGGCHADMMGIRDSYIEAEIAIKQKLKLGHGNIIVWNEELNINTYYYPFEVEEQIRNYLELELKVELTAKVYELIENLKTRKKLSCENIIQIVTQLVGNTIIKYIIEHHISFDDVFGINSNIYTEISHKETLDEIKNILVEKYMLLMDYSMVTKNRKKTVDNIVAYICNNYKKDIGINNISEYVGMSYSHVRKTFKAEIGTNIVDYINTMRVKEAKTLLLSKELSVKDIAKVLGYNNDQSFERYFKKYVGITPGEFRSRMLIDQKREQI